MKMDRASMANLLETGSPFLDTACRVLASVRDRDKVGLLRGKPLLRRAMGPLLPRSIWNRPKRGFGGPTGSSFRGELERISKDELLSSEAETRELLNQYVLKRMWHEHQREERDHGSRLWTVLSLERWLREMKRKPRNSPPPIKLGA